MADSPLTAELRNDPLNRNYAVMTDRAVTDNLNVKDRAVEVSPNTEELLAYLIKTRYRASWLMGRLHMLEGIKPVRDDRLDADPQDGWELPRVPFGAGGQFVVVTLKGIAAAVVILTIAKGLLPGEVMGEPSVDAALQALVDEDCFQASNKSEIQAMSDTLISRGTQIEHGRVKEVHVKDSRREIAG